MSEPTKPKVSIVDLFTKLDTIEHENAKAFKIARYPILVDLINHEKALRDKTQVQPETSVADLLKSLGAMSLENERVLSGAKKPVLVEIFSHFVELGAKNAPADVYGSRTTLNDNHLAPSMIDEMMARGANSDNHLTPTAREMQAQDYLNIRLYQGIKDENLQEVQKALEQGARVDADFARNNGGYHENAVQTVNMKPGKGSANNIAIMALLIKNGADINSTRDINGWGLLHYAGRANNVEMCKWLVANKINANMPDKDGRTALHAAAVGEMMLKPEPSPEVVQYFIQSRCIDPSIKDLDGKTAGELVKEASRTRLTTAQAIKEPFASKAINFIGRTLLQTNTPEFNSSKSNKL